MDHDDVGPHEAIERGGIWNDDFVKMPFSDYNRNDENQV
jgi:hypothetical protein